MERVAPLARRPGWYAWELVETFRKLWLVGIMTLIQPGRIVQLGIAMIFCLVVMLFTVFAEPYRRRDSDFYAIFCNCARPHPPSFPPPPPVASARCLLRRRPR